MPDLRPFLDTIESLDAEIDELRIKKGHLLMRMRTLMTVEEASIWDDETWVVELKKPVIWDEEKLAPLREFYSPAELRALKNKVQEPLFNKTKLRNQAKRGGEIGKVITAAQSEGPEEIKIKRKA